MELLALGVAVALGGLVVIGRVAAAARAEADRDRRVAAWSRLPPWDGARTGPVVVEGTVEQLSPLVVATPLGPLPVHGPYDLPGHVSMDRTAALPDSVFPRGAPVRLFGVLTRVDDLDVRGLRGTRFLLGPLPEGATGVKLRS